MEHEPRLAAHIEELAAGGGVVLPPGCAARAAAYQHMLERWAARLNLSGDASAGVFLARDVADCLPAIGLMRPGDRTVDAGSGQGVPGLLLHLLAGETAQMTLVEPRHRRAAFLREVVRALGVGAIEVHQGRIEDLAGEPGRQRTVDLLLSRATFPDNGWLTAAGPLLAQEGRALLWQADIDRGLPDGWVELRRLRYRRQARTVALVEIGRRAGRPGERGYRV